MADKKRILVLGGGFGGLTAAQKLNKLLAKRDDVEIYLINRSPYQVYLTELHLVAGNRVKPEGVLYSLEKALEGTGVTLVVDEIHDADLKTRTLRGRKADYTFDYLIIACGSEPEYFGIPGMKENAFTLWSFEDALRIKQRVVEMFEKARYEADEKRRREYLTFVVGGGGFTGIEMVGELVEWVEDLCREYGIDRNEVSLMVVEALPKILPNLSEELIKKATSYLERNGVKIILNSPIVSVEPDGLTLKTGEKIKTHTLIWTGGVRGNAIAEKLGLETGGRGRIKVNEYLETSEKGIYAIGDVSFYVDEKNFVMPALVESAMQSGECAAHNIAADITGKPKKALKLNLHGNMVSIGERYCVAEVMGRKLTGFIATFIKHAADMHYLFGVGGLGFVREYIGHQFFRKNRGKSFVVENIGVSTSMVWLAILRVYLGYRWLVSGIEKVHAGWLAAGDKLVAGASTSPIGPNTPEWYAWFVEKFIFPHALFFQTVITLSELAIGTCLLLGLFTSLASLGSLFMLLNFMISGSGDMWFFMVSLAVCFSGAGHSFGLDRWVIPWISRFIKRIVRGGGQKAALPGSFHDVVG
ncbi:FAD-dependent oxidoreductase [Thermosediminibacter litoriperuensis]|uniref:NADH:ubiquinone reductase (non-electrogenic) n=1 Tax=Thermosediminibacter litoriperuensis TaxID=291989 RepID=A0A5S5AWW1_9FIRM|nr:FAD-dependent oxidoreductase [Thermosediminibacter litoriperuensis]TYP57841.1 NADH dehydrogenase [Thermosediminibacter litoriperuensis]